MKALKLAWDALVRPSIRLPGEFPLTGRRLGKAYFVSLVYFAIGTFAPVLLFIGGMFLLVFLMEHERISPQHLLYIFDLCFTPDGQPKVSFIVGMAVTTFITGFGLQMRYIHRHLKKTGSSLSKAISLNLDSIRQPTRLATAWALVWRAVVAVAIWYCIEHVITLFIDIPLQPTAELARQASGGSFIAFLLLAAIGAPLAEEIVFRGFLFRAMRASFREGRWAKWLRGSVFAADILAITLSSVIFSVEHMQFHPAWLLMLFLMGCYMCEIYRRTGTLWTGILFHAINNGAAVIMLTMNR